MARLVTYECEHCGQPFRAPRKPGPAPRYCSHAHRQRAYEERRRTRENEDSLDTSVELEALRTRVRLLEYDNQKLREELTETSAEYARLYRELHPSTAGLFNPVEPTEVDPPKRRGRRRGGS